MDGNKPKAGFVIRGGAMMVDGLLVSLPMAILSGILGFKHESVSTLVFLGYMIVMTAIKGATLGKKFFGLKTITKNGGKVGWGRSLLRETVGKLLSSLVFSLGYFWVIWDKEKQAWHDKIAGTYVICDREIGKGKKVLANILALFLPVMMILALVATVILVAINPARQIEKAREQQKIEQQSRG